MELDEERAKTLMTENPQRKAKTPFHQIQDLFSLPGGLGQKLIGFWLKSMYELIRNTGVEPGKEFRVSSFLLSVLCGCVSLDYLILSCKAANGEFCCHVRSF